MKSISKIVLSGIFALSLFTSCKKDKEETPKPKTPAEILASKSWKVTAATSKATFMGQTFNEDLMASMEECEKDNMDRYNINGTFVTDEGATKCSSDAPQTNDSGTWELLENNTKLKRVSASSPNEPQIFEIVALTETTLKLRIQQNLEFSLDPNEPDQTIKLNATIEATLTAQ